MAYYIPEKFSTLSVRRKRTWRILGAPPILFWGNIVVNRFASLIIIFLSLILFFLSVTGSHGFLALRKIGGEVKQLEEKNEQLSREIVDLNNKIFAIQKSDEVLEQKAREELGLAKPNEIVYIFPAAPADKSKPDK